MSDITMGEYVAAMERDLADLRGRMEEAGQRASRAEAALAADLTRAAAKARPLLK